MYWRNVSCPCSGLKSKLSKKLASCKGSAPPLPHGFLALFDMVLRNTVDFTRLCSVISNEIVLFVVPFVGTSNPVYLDFVEKENARLCFCILTFPRLEVPLTLISEFYRDYENYNILSGVIERC
jgi:hypothetical protein